MQILQYCYSMLKQLLPFNEYHIMILIFPYYTFIYSINILNYKQIKLLKTINNYNLVK